MDSFKVSRRNMLLGAGASLVGLPMAAPDSPVTTLVLECESEPIQDTDFVRREKPRAGV